MNFTVGILELMGFGLTLVGGGWTLLKLSLNQFETRLDEKFKTLDLAVSDVKRLELDIVRSDTRNAQTYFGAHVEGVRQWGRDERAKLGL